MDLKGSVTFLGVLKLLLLISETFARCRFPAVLQSHAGSSWWLYHVTSGGARTSDDTLYYVEFLSEQMIMTPVPGTNSHENLEHIQRECIQKNSNKTYIVRSMSGKREYYCLRFVFRSATVFQLETSEQFQRADDTHCNNLRKDPWPIIRYDSNLGDYEPCPLIGGFQMRLEDNTGHSLCDSYVMSPRFESSCEEPKGILLKLDHCKEARTILQMNYRQKLYCLANWKDDKLGLIIIAKRDDASLFWMLTMKEVSPSNFQGIISSDIIIEPSTRTKHSVVLSLQKVIFESTCADLAHECNEIKNHTCANDDIVSMTLCPESCGRCSMEPQESKCSFSKDMQGSWLGFRGTEMFNLTVEDHHIYAGEIDMRCEERDALLDTYTLVSFTDNGCYPEYKCLKVRRIFDNVVKYDYEGGPSWPVFIKHHLCTPYVRKNDIRHHQQMSLAFKAPNNDVINNDVTTCTIPDGTYESEVLFSDGNVCVAMLSKQNCTMEGNTTSVGINVYFDDCSLEGVRYMKYTCVMQLPTNDPSRRTILVHTTDDNNITPSYYCLLFDPQFKEMVVLPASKCYDHRNSDIIATHSMKLLSQTCMEGLPVTTRPTLPTTTEEMTSESFYDVIYDDLDQSESDYPSHGVVSGHKGKDRSKLNSTSVYNFTNTTKTGKANSSLYNSCVLFLRCQMCLMSIINFIHFH